MKTLYYISVIAFLLLNSCKKFLDENPEKSRVTITSVKDLQALLDDRLMTASYNSLLAGSTDEYYLTQSNWEGLSTEHRMAYTWQGNTNIDAWTQPYQIVFQANVIIDNLNKVDGNKAEKDVIKGQALFHRAFAFFHIAQLYAPPYSAENANADGIVLRLISDVEYESSRASLQESYDQILSDLLESSELLKGFSATPNRPGMLSAFGMLSRVYLSMGKYAESKKYSDLYLQHSPELTDFNTLDSLANPSVSHQDREMCYYSYADGHLPGLQSVVDSTLYNSYAENDLRRVIYFFDPGDGTKTFKGSYTGISGYLPFYGILSDEIYLNRAECNARAGNIGDAVEDLNALLVKRWKSGMFTHLTAISKEDALEKVLAERRKELYFRGTRWTDIRRLNLEGRNIGLKRFLNGTEYVLPPNDLRFTWLIPGNVIILSKLKQNKR